MASQAERAAAWLSLACAVHCLLMPIVLSVMPLVSSASFALSEGTDLVLTVLVVVSVSLGAVWSYRRHRDRRLLLWTSLGLGAYLVGHLLGHHGSWLGLSLAVGGALMLAASSFAGARLARHCDDVACSH